VREELTEHLTLLVDEYVRAGMPLDEARRRAKVKLGVFDVTREAHRDEQRLRWLEDFGADLRYGVRTLRRSPGFATVAILTLALGIGANTAIFSVVNAVMLRRLAVDEPQQLVIIDTLTSRGTPRNVSFPLVQALRRETDVFAGVLAIEDDVRRYDMSGPEHGAASGEAVIHLVSSNYFEVLGARTTVGRTLRTSDDPAADPAQAVLSDAFWTRRFNRDPAAIGKTIVLKGQLVTIVGIAQSSFSGARLGWSPDVWMPLQMQSRFDGASMLDDPRTGWLRVMGRLRAGETDAQAAAFTRSLLDRVDRQLTYAGGTAPFISTTRLSDGSRGFVDLSERFSTPLQILGAMVGLVLLVACANVSNLLLARAAARRREVAVRLAVGASRQRLIRQFMTESLVLALSGGALGVLFARWGGKVLLALASDSAAPISVNVSPDLRVLAFTLILSVSAAVLFGLMPAIDAARVHVSDAVKPRIGGTARGGASRLLVVAQVALSLVLLVGAALFLRTLHNLLTRNLGYPLEALVQVRLRPQQSGYEPGQIPALTQRILDRLAIVPGAQRVAYARSGYGTGTSRTCCFAVEGYLHQASEDREIATVGVDAGYFQTMGIPMLRGRSFEPNELAVGRAGPSPVIVNDAFASRYFRGADAVGKRMGWGTPPNVTYGMEIVGIVGNAVYDDPHNAAKPMFYLPSDVGTVLVVHTARSPDTLIAPITQAIRSLEPRLEFSIASGSVLRQKGLVQERALSILTSAFGVVAVLLAGLGLYGLMAYGVTRRTREIGLRMALGASRVGVVLTEARAALMLVAWGVASGLAVTLAGGGLIRSQLFGVSGADPIALIAAAATISGVAAIAIWIPAYRASRIDPVIALRQE
jgi:predicted permease